MRRVLPIVILISAAIAGGCAAQERTGTEVPASFDRLFDHLGDFPLGPATSRTDYLSLDPTTQQLYIAKMGAGELLRFDLAADKLVAQLEGFPKVTGVLVVPDLHRIYASVPGAGLLPSLSVALGMAGLSSGRGAIAILDTGDLHEVARAPGGVFPDGIAYDSKHRKVFVSDEPGAGILVIDVDADRLLARIAAGGEVGNVQYDPTSELVYAPIQSRNELATIEPTDHRVLDRHVLPGCRHPHGLAIAPGGEIGYVACDRNDRLLTVALASGKVLDQKPLGRDPDVLAIDPAAARLYVASESGQLSIFDIRNAAAPVSLGDVFVGKNAHSLAVDPTSHRLYFPLADEDGKSVLRVLSPRF